MLKWSDDENAGLNQTVVIISSTFRNIRTGSLAFVTFLCILTNLCLILSLCRDKNVMRRKKSTNVNSTHEPVLHLLFVDLGVGCLCMSVSVISSTADSWMFGFLLCQISGFVNTAFYISTMWSLTVLTIYRYLYIVRSLSHSLTFVRTSLMILCLWISSILCAMIPFLDRNYYYFRPGTIQCKFYMTPSAKMDYKFNTFLLSNLSMMNMALLGYVIPVIILIFCNVRIHKSLSVHRIRVRRTSVASRARNRADHDVSREFYQHVRLTIFLLPAVMIILWTPSFLDLFFVFLLQGEEYSELLIFSDTMSTFCCYLITVFNPILLSLRSKKLYNLCCGRARRRSREDKEWKWMKFSIYLNNMKHGNKSVKVQNRQYGADGKENQITKL